MGPSLSEADLPSGESESAGF